MSGSSNLDSLRDGRLVAVYLVPCGMFPPGLLSKLEYSEWAAPTVYVKKKSKEICICADFSTGLNASLKDFNDPLPCLEDIFVKLNGEKFFLKIDLSNTYLQIPVEEVSSKLLCINTLRGSCKFECLSFGVKITPAIFHQMMDTMLSGLDFAVAYLDDILMQKHNQTQGTCPQSFFTKTLDYGFKLKETTCDFFFLFFFSWKKSNTWVTLLIRMVEDQILNELLQLKTCQHPIILLHCRVSWD